MTTTPGRRLLPRISPSATATVAATALAAALASPLCAAPPAAPPAVPARPASPAPPAPAAKPAPERITFDRWFVVKLGTERAGFFRLTESTADNIITSNSALELTIKRGPTNVTIKVASSWTETPDGKPLTLVTRTELGAAPMQRSFRFLPDSLELTTTGGLGGKPTTQTLPLPKGEWLPPAAAARAIKAQIAKGDTTIITSSLEDPLLSAPRVSVTTRTLKARENVDVLGKTVPAIRWSSKIDTYPQADAEEFTDLEGLPLRSVLNMGGLKMTQLAADRDTALAKLDAPELLVATLVKPDQPLPTPRQLTRATLKIAVNEGELPPLPDSAVQRFERLDPRSARLAIDSSARDKPAALDEPAAAKRSSMIDSADPVIIDLVAKAFEGKNRAALSPADRAETLRRFVHRFINRKDLDVGFASASETARSRTGDCTEHGVLLAALLRADGLPARVASGLIYVDNFAGQQGIFGYHLWTQAFLPDPAQPANANAGRWINLDATLPDASPFDAAHILIATSPLSDEQANDNLMVSLLPLLGRLSISVESTSAEPAGK